MVNNGVKSKRTKNTYPDVSFNNNTKVRKGASVFGVPVCKELASYFEDVNPQSKNFIMMNMFFAGRNIEFREDID